MLNLQEEIEIRAILLRPTDFSYGIEEQAAMYSNCIDAMLDDDTSIAEMCYIHVAARAKNILSSHISDPYDVLVAKVKNQAKEHGGVEHDKLHTPSEWASFMLKQLDKLQAAKIELDMIDVHLSIGAMAMSAALALGTYQLNEEEES